MALGQLEAVGELVDRVHRVTYQKIAQTTYIRSHLTYLIHMMYDYPYE